MRAIKNVVVVAIALAAAIVSMLGVAPIAAAHAGNSDHTGDQLAQVRAATVRFHDVEDAKGYALFTDAAGIACIANLPTGTMGIHYVNGKLAGSGVIDALHPQALVYEPEEHGRLRLVAVEYIAFQAAWDAKHKNRPVLFGQEFMLTTAPNRFGIPAFYSLHAWIWKHNPSGMFSMWNPTVHCDPD